MGPWESEELFDFERRNIRLVFGVKLYVVGLFFSHYKAIKIFLPAVLVAIGFL